MKEDSFTGISKEWGGSRIQDQTNFPPAQLAEIIHFPVTPLYQNRDFLLEKYVANGLSAEEIGLEIVSATSTVLKQLKLLGIPIRGSGKNTRPKRHLAYGQKIVGRKVEVCKSEIAAIEKMERLRKQGFSYWKIADILNSMGVPTKTRKEPWKARSVQQILDRAFESINVSI